MKKKAYPLYYAGKKQGFSRSVVSGGFIFLSGSSGRTIETGEVSSNDVAEQTRVASDTIIRNLHLLLRRKKEIV